MNLAAAVSVGSRARYSLLVSMTLAVKYVLKYIAKTNRNCLVVINLWGCEKNVAKPCLRPWTRGVLPLVFSMMDLSTIAIKGDTTKDEEAAAAISMLKSLTNVVREFSVVAADSNGCWDNLECGMAILCEVEKKVEKRPLSGSERSCLLEGFIWTRRSTGPETPA